MLEIKKRLLVFAAVTSGVLIVLLSWRPAPSVVDVPRAERGRLMQPNLEMVGAASENVIASTWFGPLLVLLIPATLAWVSLGAETQRTANAALKWTVAVTALAIVAIWIGFRFSEPVVFCLTGDC